jgi:isoquinoline 1-oxidoreductase subunit beta
MDRTLDAMLDFAAAPVLDRRTFLAAGAGLTLAFAWPVAAQAPAAAAPAGRINLFVSIDADGTVTLVNPASEMGQGILTSNAMLVAEELDADWSRVRVAQAPNNTAAYGNPAFGGSMTWGGSRSTVGLYLPLRTAGAQARRVLMMAAAQQWNLPLAELQTEPHAVVHRASGRRLGYGEIARTATVPAELPKVDPSELKPPARWRILGHSVPRLDVPDKATGRARYGIDVELPGMLVALVERPPHRGATIRTLDDAAARAMPGVRQVVRVGPGVAVVADGYWSARQAREKLRVEWADGPGRGYSSRAALEAFTQAAQRGGDGAVVLETKGDAAAVLGQAGRRVAATWTTDHVYHGPLEPMNATAWVREGLAEVWAPTQTQTAGTAMVAGALGLQPAQVRLHTTLLGGGFGRRLENDYAVEAALLSRAMGGAPVKVIWTREDDFLRDQYRPATAQHIEVALGADGLPAAWRYRLACDSVLARFAPPLFAQLKGRDPPTVEGFEIPYAIGAQQAEFVRREFPQDVGNWRAVGEGYTKFACECMLDELARAVQTDPVQYRLRLLAQEPRAAAVLRDVAQRSGWGRAATGDRALGVALTWFKTWRTYAATVADVSLDRASGRLVVHRLWVTADCGPVLHPDNAVAQLDGGAQWGVSAALIEQIQVEQGRPAAANFHQYPLLRHGDAVPVEAKLLPTDHPVGGLGEVGVPGVAPAIANAFAAITGKRLRALPMTPERVKAALG